MNKKFKRSSLNTVRILIYLAIVIVIVGLFAILPKIFSAQDMLFQTIAVVLSVVFTAVVTNQLLTGQSNNEEAREKNIKVYENKISVYADFISKMWAIMNDNKVEPEEIIALRSEIFNKLIFYLSDEQVDAISNALSQLSYDSPDDKYPEVFKEITWTLRNDIMENNVTSKGGDVLNLWNRFKELLPKPAEETLTPIAEIEEESPVSPEQGVSESIQQRRHISSPCVHFNILSMDWQYRLFDKKNYALALCEYGESWRTNLIKRCGFNDIVFLYRTAGHGYVGVFLAKGWMVFEADGRGKLTNIIECVFSEKGNNITSVAKSEWSKKIERYEAQSYIDDGCTLISYLQVEPLVYYEEGVRFISVYRKTISAYNQHYAWRTLGRFKALVDAKCDKLNKYKFNGIDKLLTIDKEAAAALVDLFNNNNVQASEWDDKNGVWRDK